MLVTLTTTLSQSISSLTALLVHKAPPSPQPATSSIPHQDTVLPAAYANAAAASSPILDSGCTDILVRASDLTAPAFSPAPHQPLHVGFPNNTSARSIGSATLTANHIEVPVSVMRPQDLHSPLLGVTPFTSQQCTAEFDDTTAVIRTPAGDPCIVAHKGKHDKAWRIDLSDINPTGLPFSMLPGAYAAHAQPFYNAACAADLSEEVDRTAAANLVQRFEGVQERVNFSQALMLHIPIRALLKAMTLGWIDD